MILCKNLRFTWNANNKNYQFSQKSILQTEHQLQKLLIFWKKQRFTWNKSQNTEYFRKNNVSRGTKVKKHSLAHHFACHCKKIIIYGGYFCRFFCFTWNQPVFLVLYCVFLVILSRQNTCLPVFFVVSCETPGIFFGIM